MNNTIPYDAGYINDILDNAHDGINGDVYTTQLYNI
jgi:hypothetical protein